MRKSQSAAILLPIALVIASIVFAIPFVSASSTASGFSDHFNGTTVDASKWVVNGNTDMSGNPAYGGNITVANSSITLSSSGSGFPCVTSASDPFPASGDFTVTFDLTYTRISDWGCGVWVSNGPFIAESNSTVNSLILQVWANNLDFDTAAIFVNLLGVQVQRQLVYGWNPSAPTQNITLEYSAGFYTVIVNGATIASEPSQLKADTIGFGHPPAYYIPFTPAHVESVMGGWSNFKIDQIKVLPQSNIALSASSGSTQLGLTVNFNGTLKGLGGQPLAGKTVVLSYMIPGVATWNAFTSSVTDSSGAFSATWLPTASGTFAVKAAWSGDSQNSGTSDVRNISVASGTGQALLLAESNSTLTALSFNTTANSVSFTVSGPSGTTGYVRFLVAKSMLSNSTNPDVYVDGQSTAFRTDAVGDMEALYFTYHHSTHDVTISLQKDSTVPEFPIWTIAALLAAVALTLAVLVRKPKH